MTKAVFLFALLGMALPLSAQAAVLTVSRVNTDDIVIPTFNNSLGVLTDVSLEVRLLAGSTSADGNHEHSTILVISTNRGFPIPYAFGSSTATSNGGHDHDAQTPIYAGGGLNLGDFAFSTSANGGHTPGIAIIFGGFIGLNPNDLTTNALAIIDVDPTSGPAHSYGEAVKMFSYSGANVSPFKGGPDIVIPAGLIGTSTDGQHSHTVAAFSIGSWNFPSVALPGAGDHQHQIDPRFTTTVTFHYTRRAPSAVPEPATLSVFAVGTILLVVRSRRRRAAA